MRIAVIWGIAIATIFGYAGYTSKSSSAIQLQDGTVYFASPPRLVGASTTFNEVYIWGATYYFTLNLPDNAGEPLQKIAINQHEGVDYIRFNLQKSLAFEGTSSHEGQKLGLKQANSDPQTQTVLLTFDPPVSPGKTITIALQPQQNPSVAGVYLFGVTAFPAGEKSHGQFLGFGRLHFYNHGHSIFSPFGW